MRALYFGYRAGSGGGHFLHLPAGVSYRTSLDPERAVSGFPWNIGHLDAGLLINGRIPDIDDGRVFWTCGGTPLWLAFYWWDRSGDKRANSNSGFYVLGFDVDSREAAFDYACSVFPGVVARQVRPLRLQP